jgi:hypothetical protein
MSRKATIGLAALVLVLAASLSLSSVASSSARVTTQPAPSLRLTHQQIERYLRQEAGHFRAAICQRRQLPCAEKKTGGKPTGGRRKLFRSHVDFSDPACPVWVVNPPRAVFATVATNAGAVCVEAISGHDIYGAPFSFSQAPEIAVLNLWDYTGGRWVNKRHTQADLASCSVIAVNISIWPLNVEHVKWCKAELGVNAGLFPAAGTYKGELKVITLDPFWTGTTMADAHSEHFCYFC